MTDAIADADADADADASAPEQAAGPGADGARLAWLFRHALRAHEVHPLLIYVQRHHGVQSALPDGLAAPASLPVAVAATMHLDEALVKQQISDLPSLPQAVLDAMDLMRNDDSTASDLASCIERDQALTARALRVANSAFYGVSGRVGTVRNAIDLLGRRTVQSLVTTSAISGQFPAQAGSSFDYRNYWMHAMAAAMAARGLAGLLRLDEEAAFTSGLLHDIGRLALAARFSDADEATRRLAQASDRPLVVVEREVLGLDHAAIGAMVARHWHFPADVVASIERHHAPARDQRTGPDVTDVVHVADAIAHGLDLSRAADEAVPMLDLGAWSRLALPAAQVLPLMASTSACVAELCEALLA